MSELGLGLIGIGRPWPAPDRAVPSGHEVRDLLGRAVELGVRFFDTAPAYGLSEARFGEFLSTLPDGARNGLVVATKCGEHWSADSGSTVDHSPEGMAESVQRSVDHLGRVDLLQLHQASVDVLGDPEVIETLQAVAETHAIPRLGASVKDVAACEAALASGVFSHLQMPVNASRPDLSEWARAHRDEVSIIGNRPLHSGNSDEPVASLIRRASAVVGPGIVLTGTTNVAHLADTVAAWSTVSA